MESSHLEPHPVGAQPRRKEIPLEPMARRYNNPAAGLASEPITYEFTNDPALLHQYYMLRMEMFRQKRSVEFSYEPDKYDGISHILVARKGKLCIGGARLTVREPDEQWLLPMENEKFDLRQTFPELHLERFRHAQLSRLAILEDYNSHEVLYRMCAALDRRTKELEVVYAFCRAPMTHCRMWKRITNMIGDYQSEILENIALPDVESYGKEYGKEYLVLAHRPYIPVISKEALAAASKAKAEA